MIRLAAFVALLILPLTAFSQVLRVSAIPDEAPTELMRKFAPLKDYLEKATRVPIKFTPMILDLQRTRKFIPTSPDNYDGLMIAATVSGLISDPVLSTQE